MKKYWTQQEDKLLMEKVEQHGAKNWKKISKFLKNRTDVQCLHRWQKVLNPAVMKGPWTTDEDQLLTALVKSKGAENWSKIAGELNGRIGKQCRERWCNHLNPAINKDKWNVEEDLLIIQLHQKYGNQWSLISKRLNGRTDNAVKNRFNSTIKRKISNTFINNNTIAKKNKITKKHYSITKKKEKTDAKNGLASIDYSNNISKSFNFHSIDNQNNIIDNNNINNTNNNDNNLTTYSSASGQLSVIIYHSDLQLFCAQQHTDYKTTHKAIMQTILGQNQQ